MSYALFISHGAPTLAIAPSAARDFLLTLGGTLPRPKGIIIISAHWLSAVPRIGAAPAPETIYDFGGFPDALYRLKYPAHTDAVLIEKLHQALPEASLHPTRGYDHGAWVPLSLLYPEADIPVVQVAFNPQATPSALYAWGARLKPLMAEGYAVIGSGSFTHNLYEIGQHRTTPLWVQDFTTWMRGKLAASDVEALLHYRILAPFAAQNHPTDEHLLPLFIAMGAGGLPAVPLHQSVDMAILAMDTYRFGA